MRYRLRNYNDREKILCMTGNSWYALLDTAKRFGWIPMGAVREEWLVGALTGPGHGDAYAIRPDSYFKNGGGMVMIEDALNIADALARAFDEYDPVPSREYLNIGPFHLYPTARSQYPGIGVMLELEDFCRLGAFLIEKF